ncbi:Hint domain-containing protein [Algicella marina]|uniref:Hedgehog/Intein (Hint) domain-containing protein n=1 Tax=Algicella marina TaxID=2683284 RepID=A0A6P1SYY3_9RHOB|nr:Hint domain-containing protein [Algicella marina]QHQ34830.1 hypothetical protein GO499_06265 [Algicella marina]
MPNRYMTIDGSGSQDYFTTFIDNTSDDIFLTITEGAAALEPAEPENYSIVGDFFDGGAVDTFNVSLPEGWSMVNTYTNMISEGIGNYYFDVLDQYGSTLFTMKISGSMGSVTNVCFTRGAMVATPKGPVAIEALEAGDMVLTRDNGAQPIRWIGSSRVSKETLAQFPDLRPVRIAAGALGDNAETRVSPQHRMLVSGWRAEALFGEPEMLATARSLINDSSIMVDGEIAEVEYFHILFDKHEIISADGAWSESFHPAALGLGTASEATRDEVLVLFPELENAESHPKAARPTLTDNDVAVLAG